MTDKLAAGLADSRITDAVNDLIDRVDGIGEGGGDILGADNSFTGENTFTAPAVFEDDVEFGKGIAVADSVEADGVALTKNGEVTAVFNNTAQEQQWKLFNNGTFGLYNDTEATGAIIVHQGHPDGAVVIDTTATTFASDVVVEGDFQAGTLRLDLSEPPSTAGDEGSAGMIRVADDAIYVCVGTDEWKKADLSTWGA